ncbi:DNA starvation/stationary phase protection protein [Vibrio cincinnatiensis]|jgi:starvation-inducible DNA-binding protein|uniref:Starvation-inducible DNA-binding protein n=1 Tax=Vibrio cincinnatiensis DSM 19608 TaxID=1123491 RepID=A0A1T4R2Q5_VIBCI|nr:Dps family protein [Vibrio cincinnatiensis]MCG3722303.1 DNA starvation/stationary phase protection protein [Vibrio cincinnatiensis]MCG3725335.1 DNA starvation/stationary phase protection protein [Vibrio cincinnatiensis]MCG3732962.1 DNA starvation/stationary phase protection protein [Vibrio cincinnatiensis]MCG3735890.1 DNA starvation/stationary phase protection protein [Vibrio cincinnatiensis]MCG3740287.1 DNA starvation/stationary phase protection protein [Vibrio cincinnatiensis]
MKTNLIGLDNNQSQQLAQSLNRLLANYQVFYMNTRGYHWNIKGKKFFELHAKFEEIYTDLQIKIDELAERILTLGAQPLHSFSDYLATTEIKEHTNATDAQSTMQGLLNGFSSLIAQQRTILSLAAEVGDEGTSAQMSDYIREQEKLVWMLNAWLQ